jgi:DNA-directed RNA polymerase specialized sigma24 family protein
MAELAATRPRLTDREQQVFEMLGEYLSTGEIADRLGLPVDEALEIVQKVLRLRGTPNLEAIRENIAMLRSIKLG